MTTMTVLLQLVLLLCALTCLAAADDAADGRLLDAAMNNRVDAVKEELENNGANINVQDGPSGQTPLMAAVLRGNTETVKILLKKGADITIGEKDGYTPAHGAGFQGRAAIMKLLHQHGIDVIDAKHTDGYAPLHRACWGREQRHADTVEVLLEIGASPELAGNGRTCAEMTRNPATLEVLKEHQGKNEL